MVNNTVFRLKVRGGNDLASEHDYDDGFDRVFGTGATQLDIAEYFCDRTVRDLFAGYNCSFVTYGSSKSGKSYTMFGNPDRKGEEGGGGDGLVYEIVTSLFSHIRSIGNDEGGNCEIGVEMRVAEVEFDKVYDLLAPSDEIRKPLKLHFNNPGNSITTTGIAIPPNYSIPSLTSTPITSRQEFDELLEQAMSSSSSTVLPSGSSVSHLFIFLNIKYKNLRREIFQESQLCFIDLAGPSRALTENGDTEDSTVLKRDNIKKFKAEMSNLKDVIDKFSQFDQRKTPNKQIIQTISHSKEPALVKLLLNPLIGNSLTNFILTCSITREDERDSLETLKLGKKLKLIDSCVRSNVQGLTEWKRADLLRDMIDLREERSTKDIEDLSKRLQEQQRFRKFKEENIDGISKRERLLIEREGYNAGLTKQLEILRALLKNISDNPGETRDFQDTVTQMLITQSEEAVELQVASEESRHELFRLEKEMELVEDRETRQQNDISELFKKLKEQQKSILELLASNAMLRSKIENDKGLEDRLSATVNLFDTAVKEHAKGTTTDAGGNQANNPSADTSTSISASIQFATSFWGKRKSSSQSNSSLPSPPLLPPPPILAPTSAPISPQLSPRRPQTPTGSSENLSYGSSPARMKGAFVLNSVKSSGKQHQGDFDISRVVSS